MVFDVRGFSCDTAVEAAEVDVRRSLQLLQACLVLLGAHYPERAGAVFLVNVPWGAAPLWAVASRYLDPVSSRSGCGPRDFHTFWLSFCVLLERFISVTVFSSWRCAENSGQTSHCARRRRRSPG
jgi:hypothetical protein